MRVCYSVILGIVMSGSRLAVFLKPWPLQVIGIFFFWVFVVIILCFLHCIVKDIVDSIWVRWMCPWFFMYLIFHWLVGRELAWFLDLFWLHLKCICLFVYVIQSHIFCLGCTEFPISNKSLTFVFLINKHDYL